MLMRLTLLSIQWLIRLLLCFTVAPKIDRRNLRDVVVSKGSPVKFDVDVSGEPAPTTKWFKSGSELK